MKLVTYESLGTHQVGAVMDGRIVDLSHLIPGLSDAADDAGASSGVAMIRFLAAGAAVVDAAQAYLSQVQRSGRRDEQITVTGATFAAPIPRPGKIVAIGRNYADHATESGVKPFENPRIIAKLPSSVTGPGAVVRRPQDVTKLDYEVELGVVIGRRAKCVPRGEALQAVAGYTVLNDVSAREFQFDVSPAQTTFAKSMDGFCPMGPWIVTRDEVPDPQDLTLRLWVNNELLQDGSTHDMIFGVAHLIEYISGFMTLEPGDVIATGTPAGVGAFRKPPRWLRPGDRLRLEVSRVGVLEHSIG
jgi:2-keto-4-pentenoate hydratase/2-oxohepta-3-ene-1,7-dioic acid hydratase in catechol pathway